ncbi:type II/IV secretion system ATPase subunit, partial [Thermofilum sp.]|uniref:type II/IV secretion system ATPase subunit n=1 Tax=Thermofilum sp. TaxID=1961369 RepID=UPI00316F4965
MSTKVKEKEKNVKKGSKEKKKAAEASKEEEKVVLLPVQDTYRVIDEYWVVEPFAKVKIVEIPEAGNQRAYFVEEVQLTKTEQKALEKLIDILSVELEPPVSFDLELRQHIISEARRLAEKYRSVARGLSKESWQKVIYYIERDLVGYGPIEVLIRDYKLEDISCDGVDRAIHVWHRDYESIPTNIIFRSRDYLREFIVKLAHMSGKHISAAFPIVDAMLPGRHRLAATYGEEVSPRGSTFTIRKFREKPMSIVEMVNSGNLDSWSAAYLWLMIENRMTAMVIGATAAGKTTLLNAIANFFKPGFKIVTIEETPELNLPHENWVQLVSRESYGLGESKVGEISLT